MVTKPKPLIATDIIIFGGKSDLALTKILPALYCRHKDGQLPEKGKIIGTGREILENEVYRDIVHHACKTALKKEKVNAHALAQFVARCHYIALVADEDAGYQNLAKLLASDPAPGRMFYLATSSDIFTDICRHLAKAGLVTPASRVVLEKPLGHDLASFKQINEKVKRYFKEGQIYRIDHYLGKETVQNLMIIRFANHLFSSIWNSDLIDHVQITVAETGGVDNRGGYYDATGAFRDMVQNHLLQLLCLVAMEPPNHIDPDAIRDEKCKVFRSLRPLTPTTIGELTVRGQYKEGQIEGRKVQAYLKDIKKKVSTRETFVAMKVWIDNWRWSGVPFYLRTGKRMKQRYSEIVLQFKKVPHHIFPGYPADVEGNKLVIRIQPDESIALQMITKVPGPGGYRLKPVQLNLSLSEAFEGKMSGAYERLLMDVVRGNLTLFMRSDEVEEAWRWTDTVIRAWEKVKQPSEPYTAGTEGPKTAQQLMVADGREWHTTGVRS